MTIAYFVTHPEVVIDPDVPVPEWHLSEKGRARIEAFCARPELESVSDVFSSDEQKAIDCAEAFGTAWNLDFKVEPRLGENDRSSTGYVAPPRFWKIVAEFFDYPHKSALGWERAADAQRRIGEAVLACIEARAGSGDILMFSHGGVGTLLLCDLFGEPISRKRGQPIAGGGCYFTFHAETWMLRHDWRDIVPLEAERI